MAENSYHLREMIEQCSRCSLPTGSGTLDQKSENVKSFVTPMPTNDPIFIMKWCFNETDHDENQIIGWHRRYAQFDVFGFLIRGS